MIESFFNTRGGAAFIAALAAGVGWLVKTWVDYLRKEPVWEQERIRFLQEEINDLRDRLDKFEDELQKTKAGYFNLSSRYLALSAKYNSVLVAIRYEGSDSTREKVERVLSSYGERLEDASENSPAHLNKALIPGDHSGYD